MLSIRVVFPILAIVVLVLITGCTASQNVKTTKDPIVGTWKQEAMGIVILADFYDNGTGVFTTDTSAYGPGTPSDPAVKHEDITWTRVSDTEYNFTINDVNATFVYDKSSNCIYDPDTTRSRLKLYKQ